MKRTIILFGLLAIATIGCAELADYEQTVEAGVDVAQQYAPVVDTVTHGWASAVTTILGLIVSLVFGVNRALLARNQKKTIIEVHNNPDTPSIQNQVTSAAAKKVIDKIIK